MNHIPINKTWEISELEKLEKGPGSYRVVFII
jgi:hypothetical protein